MSGIEVERLAVVTPLRRLPRADAPDSGSNLGDQHAPIEGVTDPGEPIPIGTVVEELRERMLAVQRHPSGRFEEASVTDRDAIHALALRALARRDHSERELQAALVARAVPAVLADAELERLIADRLIDDERLAVDLVQRLGSGRRFSRAAMIQELKRRMLPAESINRAVASVDAEVDLAQAIAFAETKRASLSGLDRGVAERRLRGQLQRRGYGGETISKAIRAVLSPLHRGATRPGGVRFEP